MRAGAVADEVDDRVRHLQPTSVRVGLAEQRDLQAFLELPLAPRLVEEHHVHPARPVADGHVDHRAAIPRHPLGDRAHRDQDERLLAGHEVGDPRLVGAIDPPTRVGGDQVEHGVDADAGQRRLLLVADALQSLDGDVGELAQGDRASHRPLHRCALGLTRRRTGTGRAADRRTAPRAADGSVMVGEPALDRRRRRRRRHRRR